MRTVSALVVTLVVSIGLVTSPPAAEPMAPTGSAPSDRPPAIEPADEVAAEAAYAVSLTPLVTVIGADRKQRALLDEALATFRDNGLLLPDVEVRYSDDQADCNGHQGLFERRYEPWRLSVCSDFSFVPYHELAHAWEAANVDDAIRARYIEARGLTNWNDTDARWAERGIEDAARIIQLNLMVENAAPEMPIWQERFEAYELLVGRPSPLLEPGSQTV